MKSKLLLTSLLLISGFCFLSAVSDKEGDSVGSAKLPIYLNTSYSFEERAADLVSRFTLEEKQSLLGNTMPAIPRLNIRAYQVWGEALHGVAGFLNANVTNATSFPNSVALGSTWDPVLMEREASAISEEGRGTNTPVIANLTYWSPVVEPVRDPRWGRTGESYSEDPFLISQIAGGFIHGIMGSDPVYLKAVPTGKHFFANNSEFNRHVSSSDMDARDMREFYLAPYRKLITIDNLPSIMTCYNSVNGIPVTANKYLVDTLIRRVYGLRGYITGDCGAVSDIQRGHFYSKTAAEAAALGLKAGVDTDCGGVYQTATIDAIKAGLISEAEIDQALVNMFTIRMRLGEFDPQSKVPYSYIQSNVVNAPGHAALAYEVATKTPVLLKNSEVVSSGKKILPLDAREFKKIAVIGPKADKVELGPYSGRPLEQNKITPLAGIKDLLAKKGSQAEVVYSPGGNTASRSNMFNVYSLELVKGDGSKTTMDITKFTASSKDIIIAGGGGASNESAIKGINDGSWTSYNSIDITNLKSLNLSMIVNGDGGSVEVRTGSITGNLLATFEVKSAGMAFRPQPYSAKVNQLGVSGQQDLYLVYNAPSVAAIDEKTLSIASSSDVAIVVVGTDDKTASEESDRFTLLLPGNQVDLIKAVAAVNPNTIVVMQTLGMVETDEFKNLPNVKGIIWSGYNGQAQGAAMASILFGDVNPGGKLQTTWYKSVNDLPLITDYALRGGDDKNGRTYWYFNKDVSYEFGYGLSYTTFEYSNFRISNSAITPNEHISISVEIRNSGSTDGDEVVQVYLKTPDSPASLQRPVKRLKGFLRVTIPAGQTKNVIIPVNCSDLWFWNPEKGTIAFDQGKYIFEIGSSSKDIRGSVEANMSGSFIAELRAVVAECGKTVLKNGSTVRTNVTASMSDDSMTDISKVKVIFTSNNTGVATVDDLGLVTAKGPGVASITASVTVKGKTVSDSYPVKVIPEPKLNSITIDGKGISGFNPDIHAYSYLLPGEDQNKHEVKGIPQGSGTSASVIPATKIPGTTVLTTTDDQTGETGSYLINFGTKSLSDEFNSGKPGQQWNWINENATNWSLTKNQGALTIISQKGDVKETSNNVENLLLQSANTDWTIESKLTYSTRASKADQQGGIIAMQDEDNYVKLVYDFGDAGFLTSNEEYIDLLVEDHGFQYPAARIKVTDLSEKAITLVLKLVKRGETYTASYAILGNNFKTLGSAKSLLSDIKAGIIVCNGSPAGMSGFMSMPFGSQQAESIPFEVRVDYFHIKNTGLK